MSQMFNQPHRLHPEMLAEVPPKWHEDIIHFINTGEGTAEFREFLDSSEAAQSVVDSAFESICRAIGQEQIERRQRAGGSYQAAEELADRSGLSLDQAMLLENFRNALADQVSSEEQELGDQ